MQVRETDLPGVLVLQPKRHGDERGFFCESWNRRTMLAAGLDVEFVQDNLSLSADANTVRGLHYQAPPHAQAKLVSCVKGAIFDVAVDVRAGSPTYGKSFGTELSAENGMQLFVPAGFLHGFATRQPETIVTYKVNDYYDSTCDGGVRWDSCGIDWRLTGDPVLSNKDANAPVFASFESPFIWETA